MEKHDLHHEFPQFDQKIHEMKISNAHFKKLFDEYHIVNNEIHSIETGATATADNTLNTLRANRVVLKDELYEMLKA